MAPLIPGVLAATSDATSNLYVLTAFGGGMISFPSPCVLPIVPGYLSLMSGLTIGELGDPAPRALRRIAINTAGFVAGFTAVFVVLGLGTTAARKTLFENQHTLTRLSGRLLLLLAAYLAPPH